MDLAQLKKPVALVFTADEEIGCLGAKRLAKAQPFTVRHAIVGEPTSLQPMRAGKGLLSGGSNCARTRSTQCLSTAGRLGDLSRRPFD